MSGITNFAKGILNLPLALLSGPDSPGAPPVQEDPEAVIEDLSIQKAQAGDIAVRNAQRRSSTLGSGAQFIAQSTAAGTGTPDQGPTPFFEGRFPSARKEREELAAKSKEEEEAARGVVASRGGRRFI